MKSTNPRKTKIGLVEIAAVAHVSVATVSRVLNGNNRVDAAIQKAVLDAAAALNVDLTQRNKTKALAFLLSNRAPLHAFHSRILMGAEEFCAAHGWDILFLSYNYSPNVHWKELHLPKVVQRRDVVRAVVLAGTNSSNLIELLDHKGIPSVVLGNNVLGGVREFKSNDVIFSDDIQGGKDMTRYLLGLGHRDIWFVGNTRLPWFARCFEGYRRAMEASGLPARQSSIESEDDAEIGYLGAKSLMSRGEPVTAIFAGNDLTARGVYKAYRDDGLRIPEDISIAGCDDTVGSLLCPALTTIREFPEQMGKKMVEMILNRIAKPGQPPQTVTIPTEFVRRDSCRSISAAKQAMPEAVLHSSAIEC
jgi:DNA-binding LacI/PurR family transcriptional regulator